MRSLPLKKIYQVRELELAHFIAAADSFTTQYLLTLVRSAYCQPRQASAGVKACSRGSVSDSGDQIKSALPLHIGLSELQ